MRHQEMSDCELLMATGFAEKYKTTTVIETTDQMLSIRLVCGDCRIIIIGGMVHE